MVIRGNVSAFDRRTVLGAMLCAATGTVRHAFDENYLKLLDDASRYDW